MPSVLSCDIRPWDNVTHLWDANERVGSGARVTFEEVAVC